MGSLTYRLVLSKLVRWGYLIAEDALKAHAEGESSSIFTEALIKFKERWHKYGIADSGEMEKLTEDTLQLMGRRFCNCPDVMPYGGGGLRKWDTKQLTWYDKGVKVGNLSFSHGQKFTVEEVARVCGMRLVMSTDPNSNIVSYSKYLDGRGGALAQAELPNPGTSARTQLVQEYDYSESNMSQRAFDITILHETGHTLGLSHDSDPGAVEVMDPFLNASLNGWQPADIKQLVMRYDTPATTPLPPPGSGGGEQGKTLITIVGNVEDIVIDGYRISKLG